MANKPYYEFNEDQATLHISQGNEKIGKGIWSFSTLPGNEEHLLYTSTKGLLTDIPGTCSKYCDGCFGGGCYAVRDAKRHNNATIPAWAENTILLRNGKLWDLLETFLTLKNGKAEKYLAEAHKLGVDPDHALANARELAVIKIFRIHVSGELENAQQLRRWNLLALAHPEIQFGMYTKNFEALAEFLDDGSDFADNLVVNVSEWHGVAKLFLAEYGWAHLNVFEYDDSLIAGGGMPELDKARLAKTPHCPAVTKEGHHAKLPDGSNITCDKCGRCYRKTGQRTAVYAH